MSNLNYINEYCDTLIKAKRYDIMNEGLFDRFKKKKENKKSNNYNQTQNYEKKEENESTNKYSESDRIRILTQGVNKANTVYKSVRSKYKYTGSIGVGIYPLKYIKEDEFREDDYEDFINGYSNSIEIGSWNSDDSDEDARGATVDEWYDNVHEVFDALRKITAKEYYIELDGGSSSEGIIYLTLK